MPRLGACAARVKATEQVGRLGTKEDWAHVFRLEYG